MRNQAAGGTAGWIATAGAAVHSIHQEPGRNPRREHSRSQPSRNWSVPMLRKSFGDLTLAIYEKAGKHAESCGLILADTKFEFGTVA